MSGYGFFEKEGPFTLGRIAELTDSHLVDKRQLEIEITGVAPLDEADHQEISYLTGRAYLKALGKTRARACFIPESFTEEVPEHIAMLKTANPHLAYAQLLGFFYPQASRPRSELGESELRESELGEKAISPAAHIDQSAQLETKIVVEAGAVIGARVRIGSGTIISAHAVICPDCTIGRDSFIGSHAFISHALIGDRVIIHAGVKIGQAGFGFVPMMTGAISVPQIGRVIIQNDVEIGANTTIDRGSTRDTMIGEGTKIDNLVQIGHNVSIGRHCFIISQVGIAGSARIDDHAVLLGQVGVADGAHIGAGARIGAQSGIMSKIPAGKDYMGYPAREFRQFLQECALLTQLWKDNRAKRKRGIKKDGKPRDF